MGSCARGSSWSLLYNSGKLPAFGPCIYVSSCMMICCWMACCLCEFSSGLADYQIYPTPPLGQDMTQGQFLNSEFYFSKTSCLTKAEEPSLSYLPITGGRIIGLIPFPGVLVLCEMQSVLSRIWTRVTEFISYDDNHYSIFVKFHYIL